MTTVSGSVFFVKFISVENMFTQNVIVVRHNLIKNRTYKYGTCLEKFHICITCCDAPINIYFNSTFIMPFRRNSIVQRYAILYVEI